MCTFLRANFYYALKFKPYFINPIIKEKKCFVFFDVYHMIKLMRNILEDKKILKTRSRKMIE